MAQIRHQDPYDLVDEIFSDAKERGVMHLVAETETPIERHVRIKGREYLNFGTCSYMSLGQDERLKKAAVAFVERYGLQFSVSRGYLSSGINEMLEDLLTKMYNGRPCLVYSATSACHISILPTLIRSKDAVILDQSVHFSVQNAAQIVRTKGVPIEMIRHSNLQMLEEKLQAFGNKYKKIWYLIDGVYSMYGDVAPMKELHALMERYEQLHLYIDDAHGMSWYGKHGSGRVFGEFGIHDRTILITTLAKGFGVVGGVAVFPDAETCRKIRVFGGPLSYSHPLSPPVTGAAIACAKIHLSEEIYRMQAGLAENIRLCSSLLDEAGLPMLSDPVTPINFACLGTPGLGMSVVKRMLDDGYYCNLSTFPVVPVKNTGLRFTVQRQHRSEDIQRFVEAAARNIRIVLKEAGVHEDEIRTQFGLPPSGKATAGSAKPKAAEPFKVEHHTSIANVNKAEWDSLLGANGAFDHAALTSLELGFGSQPKVEEHWDFDYFMVRDDAGKVALATFFTTLLMKEDIFSPSSISEQIEEKRKTNPNYLVSRTMSMGSLLTEGQHLYLDKSRNDWRDVLKVFLRAVAKRQKEHHAKVLLMRDFDATDKDLSSYLIDEGFVRIEMPLTNTIQNMTWSNSEEFLQWLPSPRRRKHAKQDILPYEDKYEFEFKSHLSDEEAKMAYNLYMNVKNRNMGINMYAYPQDIVHRLTKNPQWEFIIARLKPEYDTRAERLPVGIGWGYKGQGAYSWVVQGIDYNFNNDFKVYRQCMYQMVKRAKALGYDTIYLGLSADEEKKKVGASQHEKVAFMQTGDNFAMDAIAAMAATSK